MKKLLRPLFGLALVVLVAIVAAGCNSSVLADQDDGNAPATSRAKPTAAAATTQAASSGKSAASATSNGSDPKLVIDSSVGFELTVDKDGKYIVGVVNEGDTTAKNVKLKAEFPPSFELNGTSLGGTCSGNVCTWNVGNLVSGDNFGHNAEPYTTVNTGRVTGAMTITTTVTADNASVQPFVDPFTLDVSLGTQSCSGPPSGYSPDTQPGSPAAENPTFPCPQSATPPAHATPPAGVTPSGAPIPPAPSVGSSPNTQPGTPVAPPPPV